MSKTLEMPDDLYDELIYLAELSGQTIHDLIRAGAATQYRILRLSTPSQVEASGLKDILRFAGSFDSGDSRSADNERIDADLYKHLNDEHVA